MGERPILFAGEMVREILAGRKTQTRRRLRHQPEHGAQPCWYNRGGWAASRIDGSCSCKRISPAPPRIGDTLWVRETWAAFTTPSHEYGECDLVECAPSEMRDESGGLWVRKEDLVYHADGKSFPERWRPSIHMPRWASRLTLRVTDVRVERVQDISEEDAEREGCTSTVLAHGVVADEMETAREQFGRLWAELYGADSWDANPWVWVVGFEVVR